MMEALQSRGEQLAQDQQRRKIADVAIQLRAIFGGAAVQVEDPRVLVSGSGIIKRWLIDPSLRFLVRGLR
jgi:hypothetical protein